MEVGILVPVKDGDVRVSGVGGAATGEGCNSHGNGLYVPDDWGTIPLP